MRVSQLKIETETFVNAIFLFDFLSILLFYSIIYFMCIIKEQTKQIYRVNLTCYQLSVQS